MPSKTFHFGPESEEVLIDLFESHLLLSSLLEVSTSIVAGPSPSSEAVGRVLFEADQRWVDVFRHHWPPSSPLPEMAPKLELLK